MQDKNDGELDQELFLDLEHKMNVLLNHTKKGIILILTGLYLVFIQLLIQLVLLFKLLINIPAAIHGKFYRYTRKTGNRP